MITVQYILVYENLCLMIFSHHIKALMIQSNHETEGIFLNPIYEKLSKTVMVKKN